MRHIWTIIALGCVCLVNAQKFTDSDRYGLSTSKVVSMGYEKWLKFYGDSSQMGAEAAPHATTIYGMALFDRSRFLLKDQPDSEKEFHDEVANVFANIAKSAVTMAHDLYGDYPSFSLETQQAGYKSNLARYRMITEPKARTGFTKTDALREYRTGYSIAQTKVYPQRQYGSFKFEIDRVDKLFANRSQAEQELAWEYVVDMIKMVSEKK